jgi:hypothetical protein
MKHSCQFICTNVPPSTAWGGPWDLTRDAKARSAWNSGAVLQASILRRGNPLVLQLMYMLLEAPATNLSRTVLCSCLYPLVTARSILC